MSAQRPNRPCRVCKQPKIAASQHDKGSRRCKDCIAGTPPKLRSSVPFTGEPGFWVGLDRAQLSKAIAKREDERSLRPTSTFARSWPPAPGAFVERA